MFTCGLRGLAPPVVLDCRWDDLTCFLGADRDRSDEDDSGLSSGGGRDVVAERLAHARGEGPEPEAEPMRPAMAAMLGAMLPPELQGVMGDADPRS